MQQAITGDWFDRRSLCQPATMIGNAHFFLPACPPFEVFAEILQKYVPLAALWQERSVCPRSLHRQWPGRSARDRYRLHRRGGNGTHQVYISGVTDHRLKDADIGDHLVELVERKAAEIEAAKRSENEPGLAAEQ